VRSVLLPQGRDSESLGLPLLHLFRAILCKSHTANARTLVLAPSSGSWRDPQDSKSFGTPATLALSSDAR
jgi:hypothetical protein